MPKKLCVLIGFLSIRGTFGQAEPGIPIEQPGVWPSLSARNAAYCSPDSSIQRLRKRERF